jgi:PII-like signaling protein
MLKNGTALKVTIYLNADTGSANGFLHLDVLALLQRRDIQGASAVRPFAGFGSHHKLHIAGGDSVQSEHLPIILIFIDSAEKVEAVLPELLEMVSDGLVEVQPTQVIKSAARESRVIA